MSTENLQILTADCQIDNLIFGYTEDGQILLPARIKDVPVYKRIGMLELAFHITEFMQCLAKLMHLSDVDVATYAFHRGWEWREEFTVAEIKSFITGHRPFDAFPVGRALVIKNIIHHVWGAAYSEGWGFVYVLKAKSYNYYKIGFTTNPLSRFYSLGVKLPFKVECLCLIPHETPRSLEKELHERFADKRLNGEWFELNEEDVATIIALPGWTEKSEPRFLKSEAIEI